MHKIFVLYLYCGIIIVRGDKCSWLSRVTLAYKITFPKTLYQHLFNIHQIVELATNKIICTLYIPMNMENFCYPGTLAPTNKHDSTVLAKCVHKLKLHVFLHAILD